MNYKSSSPPTEVGVSESLAFHFSVGGYRPARYRIPLQNNRHNEDIIILL